MSGAKDCEETTDLNFDKTIPFRPFIHLDCDDLDDDVFYIQTDLVVVAPQKEIRLEGADKVELFVISPKDRRQVYSVRGEFSCGLMRGSAGGEIDSDVSIALYSVNDLSHALRVTSVRIPLAYIGRVLTKVVS